MTSFLDVLLLTLSMYLFPGKRLQLIMVMKLRRKAVKGFLRSKEKDNRIGEKEKKIKKKDKTKNINSRERKFSSINSSDSNDFHSEEEVKSPDSSDGDDYDDKYHSVSTETVKTILVA